MTDDQLMDCQTAARELMAEAHEAERLRAEVRLLREALSDHRRELSLAADALDEFAPHHTGLSLAGSIESLRTRLCLVRAELNGFRAPTPASPEETHK